MKPKLLIALVLAIGVCGVVWGEDLESLRPQVEKAIHEYHQEMGAALLNELQVTVTANPSDEGHLLVARLALSVSELRRMDYETTTLGPRDKRLFGRTIDDVSNIGIDTAKLLPDSSEKFRIIADLYAPMIRSKYKGQKFIDEMDKATERAIELDPDNPRAIVTSCKRALFAKERQGGDVEEALEKLNRALEIDPELGIALVFRGIAYDKLGKLELAEKDWSRALELNPHSRIARENLEDLPDGL